MENIAKPFPRSGLDVVRFIDEQMAEQVCTHALIGAGKTAQETHGADDNIAAFDELLQAVGAGNSLPKGPDYRISSSVGADSQLPQQAKSEELFGDLAAQGIARNDDQNARRTFMQQSTATIVSVFPVPVGITLMVATASDIFQ